MTTRSHKSNGKSNGHSVSIRNCVPVPAIRRLRKSKYGLERLKKVGQSFHLPDHWNVDTFRRVANWYGKTRGVVLTIRREQGQSGYGCWRLK